MLSVRSAHPCTSLTIDSTSLERAVWHVNEIDAKAVEAFVFVKHTEVLRHVWRRLENDAALKKTVHPAGAAFAKM